MNPELDLVQVRTVYDQVAYIKRYDLASGKHILKCYRKNSKPLMIRTPNGSAADWQQQLLARANICWHDRATWVRSRFPDGSPGDYCPVCTHRQATVYLNHYHCDECGAAWQDKWECACDDRCPKCHRSIQPHDSTPVQ